MTIVVLVGVVWLAFSGLAIVQRLGERRSEDATSIGAHDRRQRAMAGAPARRRAAPGQPRRRRSARREPSSGRRTVQGRHRRARVRLALAGVAGSGYLWTVVLGPASSVLAVVAVAQIAAVGHGLVDHRVRIAARRPDPRPVAEVRRVSDARRDDAVSTDLWVRAGNAA